MANIIYFPTNYPVRQWPIRLKIEHFIKLLSWDMTRCMKGFSADGAERWLLLDDPTLELVLDYVQEEYVMHQYLLRRPAQAVKPAVTKIQHKCIIIKYPLSPEVEARRKTIVPKPVAKAKKVKATKPEDTKQASARSESKARLIRKAKMVQRDCGKVLPEFNDDTYRAILQEHFDAGSSTELNRVQLLNLLLYLQNLLHMNKSSNFKISYDAPALLHEDKTGLNRNRLLRKMQALLSEKGKEEDKYIPWAYALGILKRQSGGVVNTFEQATPKQINAVIAALSKDAERKGRRTK